MQAYPNDSLEGTFHFLQWKFFGRIILNDRLSFLANGFFAQFSASFEAAYLHF